MGATKGRTGRARAVFSKRFGEVFGMEGNDTLSNDGYCADVTPGVLPSILRV